MPPRSAAATQRLSKTLPFTRNLGHLTEAQREGVRRLLGQGADPNVAILLPNRFNAAEPTTLFRALMVNDYSHDWWPVFTRHGLDPATQVGLLEDLLETGRLERLPALLDAGFRPNVERVHEAQANGVFLLARHLAGPQWERAHALWARWADPDRMREWALAPGRVGNTVLHQLRREPKGRYLTLPRQAYAPDAVITAWVGQMIEWGVDINAKTHASRRTALMAAVPAISFLTHGADPKLRDDDGRTALHYAAHLGFRADVEALLAAGCSVHLRDQQRWCPLDLCFESQVREGKAPNESLNREVFAALIRAGATVDELSPETQREWQRNVHQPQELLRAIAREQAEATAKALSDTLREAAVARQKAPRVRL